MAIKGAKLKDIEDYSSWEASSFVYIPILDNNPNFAARFLTVNDATEAYFVLCETFEDIREDGKDKKYPLLYDTVMLCKNNFLWYCTFFKELEEILNKEPYSIPYSKGSKSVHTPKNIKIFIKDIPPIIYQPFYCYYNRRRNAFLADYFEQNVHGKSPVDNYRVKYILDKYEATDFQDNLYPAWYSLKATTVYERYNEKINTRVRIDFKNGKFSYFVSGASDNWREITKFEEMGEIVGALLFKQQADEY